MRILETVFIESAAIKDGVIPNVKVLGQTSKNKRRYTEQAMRSSLRLYEGMAVYVSHRKDKVKFRDAEQRFGKLVNVRYEPDKKETRADLQILESHAMTERIKEDLERNLGFFGLSHDIDGRWTKEKDTQVIEAIEKVNSVDLVSDAATCKSLMEQAEAPEEEGGGMEEAYKMALAALAEITDEKDFMDKAKQLFDLHRGDGGMSEPAEGEAEPAAPTTEQTLIEQLITQVKSFDERFAQLQEQIKGQKPKKFTVPTTKQKVPGNVQEQTSPDAIPSDREELKRWFRKAN